MLNIMQYNSLTRRKDKILVTAENFMNSTFTSHLISSVVSKQLTTAGKIKYNLGSILCYVFAFMLIKQEVVLVTVRV